MSDIKGPIRVADGHYSAEPGVVNPEAEYIRDSVNLEHVYHICSRAVIEDLEEFKVGRVNYNPILGRYYCERCHTWKPRKDFWREKDGTGTEGHA